MSIDSSKILLCLSETDAELQAILSEKSGIESAQKARAEQVAAIREQFELAQSALSEGSSRQSEEEERLREEQERIVERRKQLSALGGVKGAKLVERELDIARRVMQSMEEQAMKSMERVDSLSGDVEELKSRLEALEAEVAEKEPEEKARLEELEASSATLAKDREKQLGKLSERLSRLYERVRKRYPGSAIARAQDGACRSCYRALPQQIYNQVLAGNTLIQCPGCSRILVHVPGESEE